MLQQFLAQPVVRSAVTTFLATLLATVPLQAIVTADVAVVGPLALAALLAALRTAVAYLDPGNTSFGVGSATPE